MSKVPTPRLTGGHIVNSWTRDYAAVVMERPKGVTSMASIFLIMTLSSFQRLLFLLQVPLEKQHQRTLALYMVDILIGVTIFVGLRKMQSWSRWLAIVVSVVWLVFIPRRVPMFHGIEMVGFALRTLFSVWVIWYLFQSHVKDAFRTA